MGEISVLIIDENSKELHQIGINLTGMGFTLATADNIKDVLRMFQLRDIPQYIFLSDSIKNQQELFSYIRRYKREKSFKIEIIMVNSESGNNMNKTICRPLTAEKILEKIKLT